MEDMECNDMNYAGALFGNLDPRFQRPASRLTDASDVAMFGYLDNGQFSPQSGTLSYINSYLVR